MDKNKTLYRSAFKWLISLLITVAPLFLSVSLSIRLYLMITFWAIMMWMFELVPEAVVGILIPVLYVLCKVTTPQIAFSGWMASTPWITIGGLMIGSAFVSSGLVKRMAYKALLLSGGSLNGVVFGLTLTCIVLTPLVPSVMAKAALMTPIVIGICKVLGVEKKSKTASALMLVVFFALWSPKMAFVTASADSVLAAGVLAEHYEYTLSWMGWVKDMFLPAILWTFLSVALIYVLKPPRIHLQKLYLETQYQKLGKMSLAEKKTIGLSLMLLFLLMTDSFHHLDVAWIMIVMGSLCFFPGLGVIKAETFNQIRFSIVFFLVGAVAIGNVTVALGIDRAVVEFMTPFFVDKTSFFLVMSIYIFSILANFILNPLALIGVLMGPIADICTNLGYPSILGGYAMIMGFNQALFPYEIAPLMLVYGFGYLKMGHLIKVMAVRILVGIIFMALIVYPYWKLIGVTV